MAQQTSTATHLLGHLIRSVSRHEDQTEQSIGERDGHSDRQDGVDLLHKHAASATAGATSTGAVIGPKNVQIGNVRHDLCLRRGALRVLDERKDSLAKSVRKQPK